MERRLEAGGTLAFGVPFELRSASARPGSKDRSRIAARAAALTAYASRRRSRRPCKARIFALKAPQSSRSTRVFRAKIAEVAVEGVVRPRARRTTTTSRPVTAQANCNYGFGGDSAEPMRLRDDTGAWIDADSPASRERFWSMGSSSRSAVTISGARSTRRRPRSGSHARRSGDSRRRAASQLVACGTLDEDLVLEPKQVHFSRAPNDRADRLPDHGLGRPVASPAHEVADIVVIRTSQGNPGSALPAGAG
ncbi:MAG: hypothetical protein M5U07_16865, partial [Xanthobacteraceae bacterium]|nr:hypothetical protein [Xanthobacteraceae bacterium]